MRNVNISAAAAGEQRSSQIVSYLLCRLRFDLLKAEGRWARNHINVSWEWESCGKFMHINGQVVIRVILPLYCRNTAVIRGIPVAEEVPRPQQERNILLILWWVFHSLLKSSKFSYIWMLQSSWVHFSIVFDCHSSYGGTFRKYSIVNCVIEFCVEYCVISHLLFARFAINNLYHDYSSTD